MGCCDHTLLHASARSGSAEVSAVRSPLYNSSSGSFFHGQEGAARRLLLAGVNVNFRGPDDGRCVLIKAIEGGLEDLVNDLVLIGVGLIRNTSQELAETATTPHRRRDCWRGCIDPAGEQGEQGCPRQLGGVAADQCCRSGSSSCGEHSAGRRCD